MAEIFKRLGSLAIVLDEELHALEARYRVLSSLSHDQYDGRPAEKSLQIQREIQTLRDDIETLIQVAESQYQSFDGFLKDTLDTLEEFDEKIHRIEEYASNYGYVIPSREAVDLRAILTDIEREAKEEAVVETETRKTDTPNLLEHGGMSRETLAKLGIKGLKITDTLSEEADEKNAHCESVSEVQESDEDTSPLPSILKKPRPLRQEVMEESRVEISPGLFTKRPSKSLEKEKIPKSEKSIQLDLDQSPQLPQLKTVDLKNLISEKQNCRVHEDNSTPELPEFRTTEVQHWSTQKKSNSRPKFKPGEAKDQAQISTTPELPAFQSLGRARPKVEQNKENDEPVEHLKVPSKSECETPELPDLKTINLAILLKKSQGTDL